MRSNAFRLAFVLALTAVACGNDPTDPGAPRVKVTVQSGDGQFGNPQGTLAEPLDVMVTDATSGRPLEGVVVTWRVVQGTGASLTPPAAETGTDGIASTTVRLGADTGPYAFEATAPRLVGQPASFDARAVLTPTITAVPAQVNAGAEITITGTNFSPTADENTVLFSGFRGRVVSATTTQLRVVVPPCLPSRAVSVIAALGAVASNTQSITVTGGTATALQLNRGEVRLLTDPLDLECQRVTPQSGSAFLIIPQNVSQVAGSETFFELTALADGVGIAALPLGVGPGAVQDFGSLWELRLRSLERQFRPAARSETLSINEAVAAPEVGDRRTFRVFNKDEKFVNVTAEVMHISQRAIIYQDLNAPANGFTLADFQTLGSSFDSPTYDTDVAVFGAPSDIDANGKVIMLLTPLVNELTPRSAAGFVAGFFFGCDLQTTSECSGSNRAEMFYGFVPDPTGRFGDVRTRDFILRELLPVVAHELQHMISFGARQNLDALWLSEGLAHMAEDLVGDAHAARGDAITAQRFRAQNFNRARFYLQDATSASMIAEELPGSLELRGAAWLMLKYLAGHYGGNALLRNLSDGPQSGVQNVTASTGQPWSKLMSDWAVALWADDAPELAGVTLRPEHSFPNINLRATITNPVGAYTLSPLRVPFDDFVVRGKLAAASQRHVLMESGANPKSVNLAFTGQRGGPFGTQAVTQISILRVR